MYRTAAQIESIMNILAAWYPQYCTRIPLPETSVEGRTIHALRVRAGDGPERRGVLMIGGTHARELMNPDALIELAIDLVASHSGNSDLNYGGRNWPANTVRLILETLDLWMIPVVNPDGRHHVMNVDDMWRKNRRNNPGTTCDGVDLNRNLDVLWGVTEGSISCSPCSDVYCGPSAFSEPETRNVKYLLDTRRIDCFADVHSYSELVLYPWGHAWTQTTDPTQVFTGLPTGTCSPIGVPGYEEYMLPRDLQRHETVAQTIAEAMDDVNGATYTPQPSRALYATTGTFDDYVYARHIADPELRKTYSFTFETGGWEGSYPESFHPADPEPAKNEGKSGLLSLAQQCICAIELIGGRLFGGERETTALRHVRDEMLATTSAGREWIGLFERVQAPMIESVAGSGKGMKRAGALIQRAVEVLEKGAVVTADDLELADKVLARVAKHACGDHRRDVAVVRERSSGLRGAKAEEIIEHLMQEPPGGKTLTGKDRETGADTEPCED